MVGEQLIQQDGLRVRFGSGGAPGAPAPKPEEASRSSGCNKGRKDLLLERVNARAVPEKVRLSNREGAGEPTPLRALIRKGRKPGQVLLRRSDRGMPKGLSKSSLQVSLPVFFEGQSQAVCDQCPRLHLYLIRHLHSTFPSSASVNRCSSSSERKVSRSWINRTPSESAAIPATKPVPGSTASGNVTSSDGTSCTPRISSTGKASF